LTVKQHSAEPKQLLWKFISATGHITPTRLALFRAVKEAPGSITDIAARLHRDHSAVKRDLDELEQVGLVTIAEKVLPGHGRMKEVRAAAPRFQLMAEVA
jgi:predicted transcriptional regulator